MSLVDLDLLMVDILRFCTKTGETAATKPILLQSIGYRPYIVKLIIKPGKAYLTKYIVDWSLSFYIRKNGIE